MAENNLNDIFGEETESASDGIDLGDIAAGDAAEGGADASEGGEEMSLDPDLASMLEDSPSEEGSGGEEMTLDSGLDSSLGGESAGEGLGEGGEGEGIDLGGLMGGEDEAAAVPEAGGGGRATMADGLTASKQTLSRREAVNLDFLLDVKLDVTFEVGRSKMLISDLLTLGQGSVVELHRLVGEELDLMVNGKLIAKGDVVVVNEKFGCKITLIISPEERIKHLAGY